ncbi:unnamed protein product [Candidula unifasciata]|uniref:Major facilitator superfamily (MFS) profile domain-containing protein n=1 Tax=Candidula unifasciata TaxID=100452 RepID=A0A8S3YLZ8_9EUPU|nr:unnamed protein product [Candidula unifasciata]
MNLADILKDIGNEGVFQVIALLTLAMPKLPMQWSMTVMSYAAYEPEWCCVPQDIRVDKNCNAQPSYKSTYGNCDLNSTVCSRKVFLASDDASTAVTEWDLVCEKQWIVSSLSAIQMGGVMVGALVSGFLSDVFGRKKVHFLSILVHALLNLGAGFSNSWQLFAVFRFFIGGAIGSYLVVHVPYILEFVSPRWRVIPASLPFAALGASLLPMAAWLLPDWRWMHFICAILCAPFLIGYFFLPESMRWLTVKGRVEDAAKVIEQIARINKKQYNADKCFKKIQKIAQKEKELVEKGKKYSYLDVYRGWKMARLTLTLQFVWFTTSLVGYGIILGISELAGNVYLNMFLVEAVEIPFIVATYYFSNRIGRRITALVYFILCTLTALAALIFHLTPSMPYRETAITVMCICCRSFVSAAAAVFIVVSTEVYPTVIRTLGYGAANTAAKIGGVLAPFLINMDTIPTVSYSVIFGTCLLCVAAVLSLSETKNMQMEDTLVKAGSKASLLSSLSVSSETTRGKRRRSSAQTRLIIDIDTDLIHHRSYSEYDDEDDDDETDDTGLVKEQEKVKENSALLHQRHKMYDPALASSGQPEVQEIESLRNTVTDTQTLNDNIYQSDIGRTSNDSVFIGGPVAETVTEIQQSKAAQKPDVALSSVDERGVAETHVHRTVNAGAVKSDPSIRDGRDKNNAKFVQEY